MIEECKICGKKLNGLVGLSVHLTKEHKDITKKEYYDKFLKKENEGKCFFCENDAIFKDIVKGYHKICDSKKCLGKTRATGTYEFLMYKYGLSEKDAIKLMNSRAEDRGKKIKCGLQKSFDKNENFFKEKSRQNIIFWLKKGYSQEMAEIEVKKVTDEIHTKTWDKRRKNPELYKDINTTQIAYWLKRGYTEDESKEKIAKRQLTFTLEKCIQKYGDVNGLEIWTERQKKWSEKIEIMYKNGLFVKFKKEPYSKDEIELFSIISEKL
jgi:hypothetical protein